MMALEALGVAAQLLGEHLDRALQCGIYIVLDHQFLHCSFGLDNLERIEHCLAQLGHALADPRANLVVGQHHVAPLEFVRQLRDRVIHAAQIAHQEIGPVVLHHADAARPGGVGDELDDPLPGGDAFGADLAGHRLLYGAQTGSGAHATRLVERMDVFRVALLHHAPGRRQQIGHEIDLFGPRRGVVEIAPHQIGLAGDNRGQQPRPATGLELERHADTGKGRPHQIGVEPDQLVEFFRVAKREGRAFATLGNSDRLADQRGIFGGERLRLALAFRGQKPAGPPQNERQSGDENRNAHSSPPVAITPNETGHDSRYRSQIRSTSPSDEVAVASDVPQRFASARRWTRRYDRVCCALPNEESGGHPDVRQRDDCRKTVAADAVTAADRWPLRLDRRRFAPHEAEWSYRPAPPQIAEIEAALSAVRERGLDITDIRRADLPLPTLGPVLDRLRTEVLDGRGFVLLRGMPVEDRPIAGRATAYWGVGTYFGSARSQNAKGHLLGHVYDLGAGLSETDPNLRSYATEA